MSKSQNAKNEQQKDLCITSEQLTEQWKKGELPEGLYWVKHDGVINILDNLEISLTNVDEILDKVPSFEQWKSSNKVILTLMDNIKDKSDLLLLAMVKNADLKELLKDCKEILYVEQMAARNPRYIDELRILIKRINQALGEE